MIDFKKIDSKWYYIVSEFFNKGSSYIMLLFLSYFLTDVQYGYVSLFNSILTLAIVFAGLDLTKGYITRVYFDKDTDINDVIGSVVTFLLIFNVIAVIAAAFILKFETIYSVPTTIIFIGILTAVFTWNFDMLQALFIAAEKKINYFFMSVAHSFLTVLLTLLVFFVYPKSGIYSFIGAKLCVAIVFFVFSILYFIKIYHVKFKIHKDILIAALKYSLPLIMHTVSGFLLNYFDKFMINDMIGTKSTALYAFAYNLAMVLQVTVLAINQGFKPKFYRLLGEKKYDTVEKIIDKNTLLLFFMTVSYIVLIDNITFLFPAYYRNIAVLVFLLIFSYILFHGYVIYANYLYYEKNTMLVFINTTSAGVVNVLLNALFIPKYGYIGATVATLISYVMMYILFYFGAIRFSKGVYSFKKMSFALLGTSACIIVYYFARQIFVLKLLFIALWLVAVAGVFISVKKGRLKNG